MDSIVENHSFELVIDQERIIVEALKSFTTKAEIDALEAEMLELENLPISVSHAFCKGIYSRTVTLPRGSLAIGHEHTSECLNIVVSGSVSVVIDGQVRVISAPATFVSPPGTRKIGYVHSDLTWITVHPVDSDELSKLENDLIVKTDSFKKREKSTALVAAKVDQFTEDRIDYFRFVSERGLNDKQVDEIVMNESDRSYDPCDSIVVQSSGIQGNGVFSRFDFPTDKIIGAALIDGKRTKIGRYCNHSKNPNAKMVCDKNGNISLVSISNISNGQEITVNYRDSTIAAISSLEILNKLKI